MRKLLLASLCLLSACAPGPAAPTQTLPASTLAPTLAPALTATAGIVDPTATFVPPTRTPAPSATPFNLAGLPQGEWVKLRGMPTARSEMTAVTLDGMIYVIGGYVNGSAPWRSSKAVEVYDPATNLWSQRAALPMGLNHMQAAAHKGKVYVFGGLPDCECEPGPDGWVYDPATNNWTTIAPLPDWRIAGAAVSLGDYVYLVGGQGDIEIERPVSNLLRYDPAADTWAEMAALNEAREHTSAVVYEGRIYVFGGRWNTDLKSMEIYDPATDTWVMGPSMRDIRAGFGAAVVQDRIYVAGGEIVMAQFPEGIVNSVEVYDPALNRWVDRFQLPIALHGVPAASTGEVLYVLGGSSKPGDVSNNGQVWAYKP